MKNKYTWAFAGYYLIPFVLNYLALSFVSHVKQTITLYIVILATVLCHALWAWFTPNQYAVSTALVVAVSWLYVCVFRCLLFFTTSVVEVFALLFVGFIAASLCFVPTLLTSNHRFRCYRDGWKNTTVKSTGGIFAALIVALPLCLAIIFNLYMNTCRFRQYIPKEEFVQVSALSAKAGFPLGKNGSVTYYKLNGFSTDDVVYTERPAFLVPEETVCLSKSTKLDTLLLELPIKHLHVTYGKHKTVIRDQAKIRELIVFLRHAENSRPIADGEETIPVIDQDISTAYIVFDVPCDLTWRIEMERTPHGTLWVHMQFDSNVYDVTHILGEYFDL